jgi:hypothetical protein
VPIDNQQLGLTLGGPILKDRLHFFSHYDYEREPKTSIWNTPYPSFNVELHGPETIKMGGARLDYQLSSNMRLMGKFTDAELAAVHGREHEPSGGHRIDPRDEPRVCRAVHARRQQSRGQ